jgi:hypothetical protein
MTNTNTTLTTVLRFQLEIDQSGAKNTMLLLPDGAKLLTVTYHKMGLSLYVLANGAIDAACEPRHFTVVPTGKPIDGEVTYVATTALPGVPAFHVFELAA